MTSLEAILTRIRTCPGPGLRQLVRELGLGMGTVQYHLQRLAQIGAIYALSLLPRRPRYFPAEVPRRLAEVIYVIREPRAAQAVPRPTPEEVVAVIDRWPCLRKDLAQRFLEMWDELLK